MDLDHLRELIAILESSDLNEMEIEEENCRVRLSKGIPAQPTVVAVAAPAAPVASAAPAAGSALAAVPAEDAAPVADDGLITIDSPMVGVFYAAPAPGEDPFVKPGAEVAEGQTVCIVEAMKLMNEVQAKMSCVIEEVLVENGEPVEYNQPLFAVRPVELG